MKAKAGNVGNGSECLIAEKTIHWIVRRLTPTECERLQGCLLYTSTFQVVLSLLQVLGKINLSTLSTVKKLNSFPKYHIWELFI